MTSANGVPATRVVATLLGASLCVVGALLLGGPLAATAAAQGERAVDTYCSQTGDYCTEITRKGRRYFFKLVTFAHRGKARFCVNPKGPKPRRCKRRRLRNDGDGVYLARINWNRNYPSKGKKRRRVTTFAGGSKLGPALVFKPA